MKLANYNIRAFCVVLQELPDKQKFIASHFKDVGVDTEWFNGVSAAVSGLKTIHTYEIDAPGSGWNIGPRPVATWLSFYMLYAAMQYMPETHFMQMEWDAKFPTDWRPRVEQALRDVPPDFDLLLIGSCCCAGNPQTRIAGDVWDVRYPQCGHATIVAKKALPIILSTQRKVYAPFDISMRFHSMPHLKVYTVLPSIVSQFGTELKP